MIRIAPTRGRRISLVAALVLLCMFGTSLAALAHPVQDAIDRFRNRAVPAVLSWVNAGLGVGQSVAGLWTSFVLGEPYDTLIEAGAVVAASANYQYATEQYSSAQRSAQSSLQMEIANGVPPAQALQNYATRVQAAHANWVNAGLSFGNAVLAIANSSANRRILDVLSSIGGTALAVQNYRTASEFMIGEVNSAGNQLKAELIALAPPPPPPVCPMVYTNPLGCLPPPPPLPGVSCSPPRLPAIQRDGMLVMIAGEPEPPWCDVTGAGPADGQYDPVSLDAALVTPVIVFDGYAHLEVTSSTIDGDFNASGGVPADVGALEDTRLDVLIQDDAHYCNPDKEMLGSSSIAVVAAMEDPTSYSYEIGQADPMAATECVE